MKIPPIKGGKRRCLGAGGCLCLEVSHSLKEGNPPTPLQRESVGCHSGRRRQWHSVLLISFSGSKIHDGFASDCKSCTNLARQTEAQATSWLVLPRCFGKRFGVIALQVERSVALCGCRVLHRDAGISCFSIMVCHSGQPVSPVDQVMSKLCHSRLPGHFRRGLEIRRLRPCDDWAVHPERHPRLEPRSARASGLHYWIWRGS